MSAKSGKFVAGACRYPLVRPDLLESLRCPQCKASTSLRLSADECDSVEVRNGNLTCGNCGYSTRIAHGLAYLLHEAPEAVLREAEGLERFARIMVEDGWTKKRLLALPYDPDGYWFGQATLMHQVLHEAGLQPGDRILDVGANTCWASAMFAERQLRTVALDITDVEWQGLGTGEWWFQSKQCYFDRVLGRMDELPFAAGSFDWIWCCQVLHHNPPENLNRTMSELFRVLRPGGRLIVANEPLLTLRQPRNVVEDWISEFEGEEHAYWRWQYVRAARRAGFATEVRGPWYHRLFQKEPITLSERMTTPALVRAALSMAARRQPWITRPYLAWRSYIAGGTALHMMCTRPNVNP